MKSLEIIFWAGVATFGAVLTKNLLTILKESNPKSADLVGSIVEAVNGAV